jgi:hyperpolarization activated cyclic nucleotide-gated potassium channel 1
MIVGVGIYSFTIGALTSILSNQDTREGYLSAKLILMDEFGKDTRLPKELRLKIKRTLEYNSVRNVFN